MARWQIILGHFLAMLVLILAQLVLLIVFAQVALQVGYFRAPLGVLALAGVIVLAGVWSFWKRDRYIVGLIFAPREHSSIKLLFGQGFRPPNVYELYYDDGATQKGASGLLSSEKVRTYELVWEHSFGAQLRTTLCGYAYRLDGLTSQTTDPADGRIVFGENGPLPGEMLTDLAKAAGHVPPDDRAFGRVFRMLSERGEIRQAGWCERRKGHGTGAGRVWEACSA